MFRSKNTKMWVFSSQILYYSWKVRNFVFRSKYPLCVKNLKIECLGWKYSNLVEKFENGVIKSNISHFRWKIQNGVFRSNISHLGRKIQKWAFRLKIPYLGKNSKMERVNRNTPILFDKFDNGITWSKYPVWVENYEISVYRL